MVLGASLEEGREEGGGEKVKKGKEETKEKPLVSLSLFLSAPRLNVFLNIGKLNIGCME